jgi:hypothetical protein
MQTSTFDEIKYWRVTVCYTDQSKRSAKVYDISQITKFVRFIDKTKVIENIIMNPVYDETV